MFSLKAKFTVLDSYHVLFNYFYILVTFLMSLGRHVKLYL